MTWEEIERVLGSAVVAHVQNAVREAYVVAGQQADAETAETALDALLVSLAAAVIRNPRAARRADHRVDKSCRMLRALVEAGSKGPGTPSLN